MRKLLLLLVLLLALFAWAGSGGTSSTDWQNHLLHLCKIAHMQDACPINETKLQITVARQSCTHVWVEHKPNGTDEVLADHCSATTAP